MAQQTELSVIALPGGIHVFVAKTEVSELAGPWRVAAMQAATSGAIIAQAAVSGAQAAEAGVSGAIIAEGVDHG